MKKKKKGERKKKKKELNKKKVSALPGFVPCEKSQAATLTEQATEEITAGRSALKRCSRLRKAKECVIPR